MMKIALALLLALLAACNSDKKISTNSDAGKLVVNTLYINGVLWSANQVSDASVLAVKGDKIVYVGNGGRDQFVAAKIVDLDGKFMMPGFVDNHVHFFEGGAALTSVNLRDVSSKQDFVSRIKNYISTVEKNRWVLNGNWDHENWGGELPSKNWIDAVSASNPVFVIRLDGHIALANSAALLAAGIDSDTEDPAGGEIGRNELGEPNGILKGNALNMVLSIIPQPSTEEVLDIFNVAQAHALSLGLTQVHAVTANPTETTMLDAFRLANASGDMKIRALVYTPIEHWQDARDLVNEAGAGGDTLRWGGVKGFVDGSLGATTAWFHKPYTDALETNGAPLTAPDKLAALIAASDKAGLRLAIHAIGDKAIDQLIAIYKTTGAETITNKRYRIEHFQHPSSVAITAAASNGIVASMQPYHAIDDGRWAQKRIGEVRVKTTYAFRAILDAGVKLSFGSDWPVAPLSPLAGVYAAVTRRTTDGRNPDGWQPQEKINVSEALTAYTAANAYAGFDDNSGELAVGMRADLVVLSDDPRKVDPITILDIKVLKTIIAGATVYQDDDNTLSSLIESR